MRTAVLLKNRFVLGCLHILGFCCLFACQVGQGATILPADLNPPGHSQATLLPVSKGDTISRLLPTSKGDTLGYASMISREPAATLTMLEGRVDLPFAGKQLNLKLKDWETGRQLVSLLSEETGGFQVDGVSVGKWLYLVAEGQLEALPKKAVFAAVIEPQSPVTVVELSLESSAVAAVLLYLQAQQPALLAQQSLSALVQELAPLVTHVLAELTLSPGQPLLNYVGTSDFEAVFRIWQEQNSRG